MAFGFLIFLLTAVMMTGIGISQVKSKEPVGFYSGEKPPCAEELTDVEAWNKKHGWMWITYGILIMLSWCAGAVIGDSVYCVIPYCGGLIVPIVGMIWYHGKLIKKYKK